MGNDFLSYITRLESMAFFAGYPLVYAFVYSLTNQSHPKSKNFFTILAQLLPFAYALAGSLYLGLLLKNMYPDYSLKAVVGIFQQHPIKIWGLLSILFWIPALGKKTILSLLHSLVFFFFILKDIFFQAISSSNKELLNTDMHIYSTSILLNVSLLLIIAIIHYLFFFAHRKST
ncbi:MAG: hypothetical protein JST58_11620 [Bacteroidetes bacterium]|nr:hypothetical protein [Bacteroidota bacterium]